MRDPSAITPDTHDPPPHELPSTHPHTFYGGREIHIQIHARLNKQLSLSGHTHTCGAELWSGQSPPAGSPKQQRSGGTLFPCWAPLGGVVAVVRGHMCVCVCGWGERRGKERDQDHVPVKIGHERDVVPPKRTNTAI